MEKAYKVEIENLRYLSIDRAGIKETVIEYDKIIDKLEKFLRTLEKKFGEIIWYIGTDYFENDLVERFMFKKSGFMEITLKNQATLEAYFPEIEKAEKFKRALEKTFEKLRITARISLYIK